jgi:hypothetical protein
LTLGKLQNKLEQAQNSLMEKEALVQSLGQQVTLLRVENLGLGTQIEEIRTELQTQRAEFETTLQNQRDDYGSELQNQARGYETQLAD